VKIDGLQPGRRYHFQLRAGTDTRFDRSADVTFNARFHHPPGGDIDFGWLKPEQTVPNSQLNLDLRRAAVLLHAACTLVAPGGFNERVGNKIADTGPGDPTMAKLVGRAALLRLLETDNLAIRVAMGVAGARWTAVPDSVLGPMIDAYESYQTCLEELAPGWEEGAPNTLPGWITVADHLLAIPRWWLPPGTDDATAVPGCKRRHGNGDPIQAMVLRVWGLMKRSPSFLSVYRARQALDVAVPQIAWLQGNALPIDEGFCRVVPESENHQWLIRTTRYLHNDMQLATIDGDPRDAPYWVRDFTPFPPNIDNNANGVNDYIRTVTSGWLNGDFKEYNSRPYGAYQIIGLLNLYDFSGEREIKNRAHEVLDFLSVKHTAESLDRARIAPYRRRIVNDSENLLDGDPLASMYQIWVGGMTQHWVMPGHMEEEMTLAASSGYAPPKILIDRMLRPARSTFFERFNGQGQREAGFGGPGYTIAGGGARTDCPYPLIGLDSVLIGHCKGSGNDGGVSEPIVLLVHRNTLLRRRQAPFAVTDVVRAVGTGLQPNVHNSLACIYRNFACGAGVVRGHDTPWTNCKAKGKDSAGNPYWATQFTARCRQAEDAGASFPCVFVYAVTSVDEYDDQRSRPNFNPGPIGYFVTHACDNADLAKRRAGYRFEDFVKYMRTTGAARLVSRRFDVAHEVRITLPAETGKMRAGATIDVTGDYAPNLSDYHVTPSDTTVTAWWRDVGSLKGDLAHVTGDGKLVINGENGKTYKIGP
jgi:hypothetical protein